MCTRSLVFLTVKTVQIFLQALLAKALYSFIVFPESSLEQLSHHTALHRGSAARSALALPAPLQESQGEVLQPGSYTVILLILTPWLQHPQLELGQSTAHRKKNLESSCPIIWDDRRGALK